MPAPGAGQEILRSVRNLTLEASGLDPAGVNEDSWDTSRGGTHRRLHLMSDVPGRVRARLNREAHEALEEAMQLCARADLLRADVTRIVAVSMASGGDGRDQGE